ncbi:MAG: PKD domain-containing protein [Thermoanaerobaculia bacterium]
MKNIRGPAALGLLVALFAAALSATTIVVPTDDQLIRKSPVILIGRVLHSEAVVRDGAIRTETLLAVEDVLKGSIDLPQITISETGGIVGDRINIVFGSPVYRIGERALVFLWPRPDGTFQTRDLFIGKFTERFTEDGHRIWFRSATHPKTYLLGAGFEPALPDDRQRLADLFESYIRERVGGEPALPLYRTDHPRFADGLSAEFTLISEPTIYRWSSFDSGGSASWRSYGTQPGYTNGGVSELRTAIAVWSGDSQASIHYSYAGAGSGSPAGLTRLNGVNEVVFNDLTNDIDGSWDPSTGGVVGRGGFNNARPGPTWNAPFTADASHTAGPHPTTEILEGNLVIQDGVSPSAGISSAVLAEIIAHELGHTLGFGHSSDSTALMYANVTGLGASLRPDDQNAAKWLYPASGSTPVGTVPAAPSNLTATATGPDRVNLSWKDNASDETAQTVYTSGVSGSFSRIGDVAANVTTVIVSTSGGQTYRFYLTARNAAGESAPSNTAQVTTPPDTVTADFTVDPLIGTAGVTNFRFTDRSTGPITGRVWTFGDGMTSSDVSPTHVYASAGTYGVALTVTNGSRPSTATRSVVVTAGAPGSSALSADFEISPASPTTDDLILFSDRSTGAVTSWSWDFGDGSTSTRQNPSKRYAAGGIYTVTLSVSDGTDSSQFSRTVEVVQGSGIRPLITADFDVSDYPVAGKKVTFTDRSFGSPTSWNWNFGDGNTSTERNPTNVYVAAGYYAVTLTSSNGSSSGTRVRSVSVAPDEPPFHAILPVSARVDGGSDTHWRTALTLLNAGSVAADLTLTYHPASGDAASVEVHLPPLASESWNDALGEIFGLSTGAGSIALDGSSLSSRDVRLSSRTFTSGPDGSYGQGVGSAAVTNGETPLYLTGLRSSAGFRTNVGVVNDSGLDRTADLTLFDANGAALASSTIALSPHSFQQTALTALFPSVAGMSLDVASLRIDGGEGITAYASSVDNLTQDPVYIAATPRFTANEILIPAAGKAPGAAGTFWRSELTIWNPGASPLSASLRFLPAGTDNRYALSKSLPVPAGSTVRIDDLLDWFGVSSGNGALLLTWSGSGGGPVLTTRTFTTRAGGGTYGQAIPGFELVHLGSDAWLAGTRSDSGFRTNVGVVNTNDQPSQVTLGLITPQGTTVASTTVTVPPKSQLQSSAAALFPAADVSSLGQFSVHAHTDSKGGLFVYGSVVDNDSGDPVFVAGE